MRNAKPKLRRMITYPPRLTKAWTVKCSDCGTFEILIKSHTRAVKELKALGWVFHARAGGKGKWRCENCKKEYFCHHHKPFRSCKICNWSVAISYSPKTGHRMKVVATGRAKHWFKDRVEPKIRHPKGYDASTDPYRKDII